MNHVPARHGYRRSVRSGQPLTIWLNYQPPLHWPSLLGFFAARCISGIETVQAGVYARTLVLHGRHAVIQVSPAHGHRLKLTVFGVPPAALPSLIAKVRRVFDLDAPTAAIEAHLGHDPLMARLLAARPGLRVPQGWDSFEQAMRTVLGQQISVAGAMTLAARLVLRYGRPLSSPVADAQGLTHVFPVPAALVDEDLSVLGMPRSRARTLSTMARALLDDPQLLSPTADLAGWAKRLCQLPGIGPWSAQYLALRQLGAGDAMPSSDLVLIKALRLLEGPEAQLAERARAWSPWRAYAAQHLWTSLS
ncbi:DNA-3-methyladenine glycosylase [Pseudomonas sp. H9]|uniref:DNA-3-methyladenine glycosylase family protein n=1 Tax=Pseudomonas sp. H9 TaxID=483968 RepID=UPI001057E038|nr:AlkA N-terminal domain-containing protein [Pseudomonas sp. H9]TDF84166.1 DNA-3-methyladenine glycosylase 2 family protein [Pseudomonas sp. H9]